MTNTNSSERTVSVATDERLLTRRLLRKLVPVSDMTIWRWERAGRFPRHLTIYGRNYWLHSEVADWMARQERGNAQPIDEAAE
jgi:predicted DNA-binding transcriptional regulator AlpA